MYKIVVHKTEDNREILILENDKLIEKYKDKTRLEGNIYIGKVKNKVEGMQAAFVDIGQENNAFIHFKDIEDNVKEGQPILVQVKKDATMKKGAKLTTQIMLTGRYLVLMPNSNFSTISQKIEGQEERERLLSLLREMLSNEYGAIIRTSAEGKTYDAIKNDLQELIRKWEEIKATSIDVIPKIIYKAKTVLEKIIEDFIDKGISCIICDDKEGVAQIERIIKKTGEKIKIVYQEEVLSALGLETALQKMENRKIWLKSGAFITIDKTEALTAIDVNSGKYVGKENLEKTSYEVNVEATEEIAKQIRLRDIGGIIVIDYIDMHEDENKEKIIELLRKHSKRDRSKIQIEGFTKLNLLEMTRKHMFSND